MNTICIISVYFGKFNNYFELWLRSCSYNKNIDFKIYSDIVYERSLPANVCIIPTTIDEVRTKASIVTGIDVNLYKPYKCCDLKPLYGLIFHDDIKNYSYWGECDMDLVWGNLYYFMSVNNYNKYDKFLPLGHLSFYRNTESVSNYYRLDGDTCGGWKTALTTDQNVAFDEIPGIVSIYQKNHLSFFFERVFADISPLHKRFTISEYCAVDGKYIKNYKYQIFYWENGKVYRDYIEDNKVKTDEFMYIHFRSRPNFEINDELLSVNAFYITRFGFVPKKGSTTIDIINKFNPYSSFIYELSEDWGYHIRHQFKRLTRFIKRII